LTAVKSASWLPSGIVVVIILMVGVSCAFIIPAGFQTNLVVQGSGGHTFADFAKDRTAAYASN
jgi:di/tricarboxylate transporter